MNYDIGTAKKREPLGVTVIVVEHAVMGICTRAVLTDCDQFGHQVGYRSSSHRGSTGTLMHRHPLIRDG